MSSEDFYKIEKAIKYIEDNFKSRPDISELAEHLNMSRSHFERMFKKWAGVTPVQFNHYLTLDYCKYRLRNSESVLNTALDAGLSGSGRLHDIFVNFQGMTPGEYKNNGAGLNIKYGFSQTPFGNSILAQSDKGIISFNFIDENDQNSLKELKTTWNNADFKRDDQTAFEFTSTIFNSDKSSKRKPFNLHIKGTNFQINVWKALLNIPYGTVVSYQDIAKLTGNPKSVRATASAIARNPVAYLIPCHRVISKSGNINNYRWGKVRKQAIVGWEVANSYCYAPSDI